MAIKKVVFNSLGSTLSYAAIGGIRFYDAAGNIIALGSSPTENTGTTGTFPNATVSTDSSYNLSYSPVDAFNTNIAQNPLVYPDQYWLQSGTGHNLTITFNTSLSALSKITFVPWPDGSRGDRNINQPFVITAYDDSNAVIQSYNVTPITTKDTIQTLNTPELNVIRYLFQDGTNIKTYANPTSPALTFSRAGQGAVTLASKDTISVGGGGTWEAWVKTTDTSARTSTYTPANPVFGDYSGAIGAQFGVSSSVAELMVYANGGWRSLVGTKTVADGKWHHIAATIDNPSRTASIYVDGVLDVSTTYGTNFDPSAGFNSIGTGYNHDSYFNGSIDEVRSWGQTLTQSTIQSNMNKQLTGSETGLKHYWKLDENTGLTVNDSVTASPISGTMSGTVVWDTRITGGPVWTTVGQTPVTEAMFTSNGMSNLTAINNAALQLLTSSTPQLLTYVKDANSHTAAVIAVPSAKIILPSGDINISSVSQLNGVTMTTTAAGSGVVLMAVSVDQGKTWRAWNGTGWPAIDISTPANFKTNGMIPAIINARTPADWTALIGVVSVTPYTGIRFAYYLEMAASTDTASTSTLKFNVNMLGTWDSTVNGTDYTYGYIDGTELQVNFLTSADFKINY